MPFTNYPQGVGSFGVPLLGQGSVYDLPPGRVWFVCNRTGATSTTAPAGTARDAPFASIADAIASIATTLPTLGDTIYVLPGHAENVTGANLYSGSAILSTTATVAPAGTRIIGEGEGNQRPALTFTAAASTITFSNASCSLENLQLLCPQTGTTTVAAMNTVTAANCSILGNDIQMSSSATALATTGVALASGANETVINNNTVWGLTGTPTSWISGTGTVGPKRVYIQNNFAQLPLSVATAAIVDLTAYSGTAPTDWFISWNTFANQTTGSTVVLKGVAGCSGSVVFNFLTTLAAATAACITTPGNWAMFNNQVAQLGKFSIPITTGGTSA